MRYETPGEAALGDFPSGDAGYVAASIVLDEWAVCVVVTDQDNIEDELVLCWRDDMGWHEGSSSFADVMWKRTDNETDTGLLCAWGHEGPDVSQVIVDLGDRAVRLDVQPSGYWIWAEDDTPKGLIKQIVIEPHKGGR